MIIILVLMIFFPLMAACCLFLVVLLDITKMQKTAREHFEKIFVDHEKARLRLEAQKTELENLEKGLQRRQEQNKTERERLYHEKKMVIFFPFQFMDELVYYIEIEIPPAN